MSEQARPHAPRWCIVPNCDDEVIVESCIALRRLDSDDMCDVMVPFCAGHGPKAGGSV